MPLDASNWNEPRDPILRTLLRAYDLLEQGWCQGTLARDRAGQPVSYHSPDAVSFCLGGSIYRASGEIAPGAFGGTALALQHAIGLRLNIATINDEHCRRKSDALAYMDNAIEARRAHLADRVEAST